MHNNVRTNRFSRPVLGLVLLVACGLTLESSVAGVDQAGNSVLSPTPPNFKIAFLGDQGLGDEAVSVLKLIKKEGAQAVVHSGDFDYDDQPAAWDEQISSVLGADFPYFAVLGNHDDDAFEGPDGYQRFLEDRMRRIGLQWEGEFGMQASFHYKGIFFVMTAPGIDKKQVDSHVYLRDRLVADESIWSIAAWHKNMESMQAGGKEDETGWEVYEEARRGGAIIATGHEHSYSRTHLLSDMRSHTVASTSDTLTITNGRTFAFVSGLGGRSIRPQKQGGPWWARIYASKCLPGDPVCEPNAARGALFGVFNVDGVLNKARFYFKDVNGRVVDSFTVISEVERGTTH